MDRLNWKELEQIPIPEGLEERLEAKIDEWEKQTHPLPSLRRGNEIHIHVNEHTSKSSNHSLHIGRVRGGSAWSAIAACVALVFGMGYYFLNYEEPVNLAEQDTYQDPVAAQQEAQKALNLLAYNLNKGMGQLEKAKAISERTEMTLNKQLNILK